MMRNKLITKELKEPTGQWLMHQLLQISSMHTEGN